MQVDNLDDILFLCNFLEEFSDAIPNTLHETKYNLCLCIIQTSIQLISYGYDPTHMLQCLNKLLIICPCTSDIVLLCVTRTLSLCSSKFVLKIIKFCNTYFLNFLHNTSFSYTFSLFIGLKVIQNYGCHKIIAQTVVASILQWNRTKVIDINTLNLFLSTVNSDCKLI